MYQSGGANIFSVQDPKRFVDYWLRVWKPSWAWTDQVVN